MKHIACLLLILSVAFTAAALAQQPAAAQGTAPAVAAATAPPVTIPLALQAEITKLQRDLLLANDKRRDAADMYKSADTDFQSIQKTLGDKLTEAGKSCPAGKVFDGGQLECVDKPPQQPQQPAAK